jgi:hypothetical protein
MKNIDLATAYAVCINALPNAIVSVKSPNGHIVQCDLAKVPAHVAVHFLAGYVEKKLGDISKGSTKGGTDNDVHDQRSKVVKTWYGGDLHMKGGGTPDPVMQQAKEEIIADYIQGGMTATEARKFVKGTAATFLAERASELPEADREAWVKDNLAFYRERAEKTLGERAKTKIVIDPAKIKIGRPAA